MKDLDFTFQRIRARLIRKGKYKEKPTHQKPIGYSIQDRIVWFARRRGGVVTGRDITRSFGISAASLDELLEDLVKRGEVSIEITSIRGGKRRTIRLTETRP